MVSLDALEQAHPTPQGGEGGTYKYTKYHSLRSWQTTRNLNSIFSEILKSALFKSYKLACYYLCIDKNPNQGDNIKQQFI